MFLYLSLAWAQSETCSAEPLERWQGQLGAAQSALLAVEVDRAETLLEDLHRGAECLSDVIPVELLVRYAQLRSIDAVYSQDLLLVEEWGQLAMSVDVPWPVPEDHPVHRFLTPIDESESDDSSSDVPPEARVFSSPRKGGVFVDGVWMPSPPPGNQRHLVQVFDGDGVRVDAWWQSGVSWDERFLVEGPAAEPPRWFSGPGVPEAAARPEWRLARKDKLKAYERYLAHNTDGEHAAEARRRVDDLVWEATPRTTSGALAYLTRFPEGRNKGGAEAVLQGVEYQLALDKGSTEALQLFLGKYPEGVYASSARRQLDERAWVDALAEGSEQAYARYRVRWPQGAHFEEAKIAQDDLAWSAASSGGRKAIEAYLRAWPQGGHVGEGRAFLKGLTFRTVAVAIDGNAPDKAKARAEEVIRDELTLLGFELVSDDPQATLRVDVTELSVGEGLSRLLGRVVVEIKGSRDPLSTSEVLIDPVPMSEAIDRLGDDLRPVVRGLSKWKRP